MKPLVIYHDHCTDGFGAAFAAWLKLGDAAEYLPMNYGDIDTHFEYTGRDLYVVDFSFPREVMEHMFANAKRVVWLDHHKTAFEMWKGPELIIHYHEERAPARHITLDNNKSGALLAWEYFHPGTEAPMLIQHIDDRDRWQFKLNGSKELHAALSSMKPWSFEQWRDLLPGDMLFHGLDADPIDDMLNEGAAILRAQDAHVKSMAKQARKVTIPYDTRPATRPVAIGLAVNTPLHQSEVGHELANKSGTYGLVWYVGADGRCKCSLRSNGEYDVSAIARSMGGGGHRNAAGFEIDILTLMAWLK